jgi:ABC-type nitrate/sulfonate/bicarbonate transport system substrate-binding protein
MGRIGLVEGEDYELLPTSGLPGQQPTVDAFESGQIVAFGGGYHDAFGVELAGKPLREITPDFLKENRAAEALTVPAEVLEDEEGRDQAVRYLRAAAKGITFMNENVEAAATIAHGVTGEPIEDVQNSIDLLNIFFFNRKRRNPGVRFGEVDTQGWLDFEELLLDGATGAETDPLAFDEIIPVENVIDNSLIDAINEFDEEEIKQQARDWIA